jgi:hypothetical protein
MPCLSHTTQPNKPSFPYHHQSLGVSTALDVFIARPRVMNTLARISAQNKFALREGLKIVRKVVATNPSPTGFTTAELFKLSIKEPVPLEYQYEKLPLRTATCGKGGKQRFPEPAPPRPDHPIKSITCV